MKRLAVIFTTLIPLLSPADSFPVSGVPVPALSILDQTMVDFMTNRSIKAGTLAVMKDRVVVYERGFGWRDDSLTEPLHPRALLRLASLTKPVTAAGIRILIEDGEFTLDDYVFDLGQPAGGLLSITPFGTNIDTRITNITVRNLLQHRGGWDRDVAGDLTYFEPIIALEMGIPSPPGRSNTVSWIMGQPLQNDPGAVRTYSNIGYLLLGMIIEQVTGTNYMDWIHANVFDPLGVPRTEIEPGRTFPEDRNPREPWYDNSTITYNVFYPTYHASPFVRAPDGNWDHEARIGQGGLIASARTMLALLDQVIISGDNIGVVRTHTEASTWRRNHTGGLPGTSTLARQRGDGINYAVLFNKDSSGTSYSSEIRGILDAIFDSGTLTNWPAADPAVATTSEPVLDVTSDGGTLEWFGEAGRIYRTEVSPDYMTWEPSGAWFVGADSNLQHTVSMSETGHAYRVRTW